jgi:hypothetical protein
MSDELQIRIVAALPSHRSLIFSSWIEEYRKYVYPQADPNWLCSVQQLLIEKLLAEPSVLAAVAVDPQNLDSIRGYLVGDPAKRVLHFIYVRGWYRRGRVATRLLERVFGDRDKPIEVTATTRRLNWLRGRWRLPLRSHNLCEVVKP